MPPTPPPRDSGSQPAPHYCTYPRSRQMQGCPHWPSCIEGPLRRALAEFDAEDPPPDLAQSFAALAGFAAGAVLFLVVVAILLPLFI